MVLLKRCSIMLTPNLCIPFSHEDSINDHCAACSELCSSRTRTVNPTWSKTCRLLVIGEAPGEQEDRVGEGFVGAAGKTLDALLMKHGLKRGLDYGLANIVRCRPPNNRRPTQAECNACLPRLAEFLNDARPQLILLVGGTSAKFFFGGQILWPHIQRVRADGVYVSLSEVAEPLRDRLSSLDSNYWSKGFRCVPMPHTSGLAWNRRCPNGSRWSEIGDEMVALAAAYLRYSVLHAA